MPEAVFLGGAVASPSPAPAKPDAEPPPESLPPVGGDLGRRRILTARGFVDDDGVASLRVNPADDVRAIALDGVVLVELFFPKGTEGRPYTQARLLREERGYRGRMRAVGAVLVDCIAFMRRCGVDEFVVRDESDEAFALAALARFTVQYQGAADVASPLWKRARRGPA